MSYDVLVVDDDAALARMMRTALMSDGQNVFIASNGQEALARVLERKYDMILLDLQMPVMDGRQFYRELRARGDETPVVIVSAFGAEAACADLGAQAALAKPFSPSDLSSLVEKIMSPEGDEGEMTSPEDWNMTTPYATALLKYCVLHSEEALYEASLVSETFARSNVPPDEIVGIHFDALQEVMAAGPLKSIDRVRLMADAHQFLLEVMISYGAKYKAFLDLRMDDAVKSADMRLARERERAEEAVRVQQEKIELLAGIASELDVPISAARGNVTAADNLVMNGQYEGVSPVLREADTALDRLSYLTGQLLVASQDGTINAETGPVDIVEVASQAARWVKPLAEERRIELVTDIDGEDVTVNGNRDVILTVYCNILSNAVRYTNPGGRVFLRCRPNGSQAMFEVEDTGIGMPEDVQSRIFQRFYRAPEARKMAIGGLGMGLTIAQRLVAEEGGNIEVKSASGEGSRFRVWIPRIEPREEELDVTRAEHA